MPKLLQINVTANWGSTGRIAEEIGNLLMSQGWESYIAFGRDTNPKSTSHLIPIGNKWDMYFHGVQTRMFDNHGLASRKATRDFVDKIKSINPDIIHLHNIHGYFLNYEVLFEYLSNAQIPIVWTLHDCWLFTGHCAYFDMVNCEKWRTGCNMCMHKRTFPSSYLLSNASNNYIRKKKSFTSVNKMTLVPVSNWLSRFLADSFLCGYHKLTIHNGININMFKPSVVSKKNKTGKFVVLGVASVWAERKGLFDFIKLRELLSADFEIYLIGLEQKQLSDLPIGIYGMSRTNSVDELVAYYSMADVYVNPTYEDNFPTTNIEALACGTPVITYDTGGSPEAVDDKTGIIVSQGDVKALADAILRMKEHPLSSADCRMRAEELFDKDKCFETYIDLYNELLNHKDVNP